ncbi:MAG: hypothetical protein ACLRMJ_01185 [Alistipes finegoldii]
MQASSPARRAYAPYAQTDYNMAENRGVTTIWVEDPTKADAPDRHRVEQRRS